MQTVLHYEDREFPHEHLVTTTMLKAHQINHDFENLYLT